MKVLDELERRAKALYPHARMLTGAEALVLVEVVRASERLREIADSEGADVSAFDAALDKLEGLVGK